MPGKLAILSIIEREFKAHAKSNAVAISIWQIMPKTGKYLVLKKDSWYNGYKVFYCIERCSSQLL